MAQALLGTWGMDTAAVRSQESWPNVMKVAFDVDFEEDGPTRIMTTESDALPRGCGTESLQASAITGTDSDPAPATPGRHPMPNVPSGTRAPVALVVDFGVSQPRAEDGDHTLLGIRVPPPVAPAIISTPATTTEVVPNPILRVPNTEVAPAPVVQPPDGPRDTGRLHAVPLPEMRSGTPAASAPVAGVPAQDQAAATSGTSSAPAAQAPSALATPRIRVVGRYLVGPHHGEFRGELGGELLIDRSRNGPFGYDPYVDPAHGALEFRPDGVLIQDFDSTNGVFIRVSGPMTVRSGDQIRAGEQLLRYTSIQSRTSNGRAPALGSPDAGYWGRIDVMLDETQHGASHPLDAAQVTFGRITGELQFPDDTCLADRHARISRGPRGCAVIEDAGSEHGTWLRLRSGDVVPYGSELLVGHTIVRVDFA